MAVVDQAIADLLDHFYVPDLCDPKRPPLTPDDGQAYIEMLTRVMNGTHLWALEEPDSAA